MPLFMIERGFAEQLELGEDLLREVDAYNETHDLTWITSFLSADKKKTFCLYEAADEEAIRRQAAHLGLPVDAITQVDEFST